MDIREAYTVMQAASGIEVGDKVRVLRRAKSREMGWEGFWRPRMDFALNEVMEVTRFNSAGGLELGLGFYYPFFVLELVEKATSTITLFGKKYNVSDIQDRIKELKEVK